jgi:hypothetical protein
VLRFSLTRSARHEYCSFLSFVVVVVVVDAVGAGGPLSLSPQLYPPPASSNNAATKPVAALLDAVHEDDDVDEAEEDDDSATGPLTHIEIIGWLEELSKYYGEDAYTFTNQEQFMGFVLEALDKVCCI